MYSLFANQDVVLRSLAASPNVDVMDAFNFMEQAQTLSDQAAQSQLAPELVQARTADELVTELQEKNKAAEQAAQIEKKEAGSLAKGSRRGCQKSVSTNRSQKGDVEGVHEEDEGCPQGSYGQH